MTDISFRRYRDRNLWLIKGFCYCLQEADTDENQGSLGFDEFCSFYKMISTRRDLYLILISYSNQKEVLDLNDLARFLENEQKVSKGHKSNTDLSGKINYFIYSLNNYLVLKLLTEYNKPN